MDPILNALEYEEMLQISEIERFAGYIQEKLSPLIQPQRLVWANHSPWLKQGNADETAKSGPDGFIMHPGLIKEQVGLENYRCGAAHESLYQGIGIVKAAFEPSEVAREELARHIRFAVDKIASHHKIMVPINCAIIFQKGIILRKYNGRAILESNIVRWQDKGGAAEVAKLFSPWSAAAALSQLLGPMDLLLDDSPRCLGSGWLGTVFPVRARDARAGDAPMALKVVSGNRGVRRLRAEFEANQDVAAAVPHALVRATRFHELEAAVGAGMLMEEVGAPVPVDGPDSLRRALRALGELHRAGFCHGSARRDNLLACQAGFKWCDLQRASRPESSFSSDFEGSDSEDEAAFVSGVAEDLAALLRSFGRSAEEVGYRAGRQYVKSDFSEDVALRLVGEGGGALGAGAAGPSARRGAGAGGSRGEGLGIGTPADEDGQDEGRISPARQETSLPGPIPKDAGPAHMADAAPSKAAKTRAGHRRRRGKKAVPDTTETKETDAGSTHMADTAPSKAAKKRAGHRRRRGNKAVPDTTVTKETDPGPTHMADTAPLKSARRGPAAGARGATRPSPTLP